MLFRPNHGGRIYICGIFTDQPRSKLEMPVQEIVTLAFDPEETPAPPLFLSVESTGILETFSRASEVIPKPAYMAQEVPSLFLLYERRHPD
jgi:hypothetical protein